MDHCQGFPAAGIGKGRLLLLGPLPLAQVLHVLLIITVDLRIADLLLIGKDGRYKLFDDCSLLLRLPHATNSLLPYSGITNFPQPSPQGAG